MASDRGRHVGWGRTTHVALWRITAVASAVVATLTIPRDSFAQRVAVDAPARSAPEVRRVTIEVRKAPLATVVQLIARQAELVPGYDEALLPSDTRVTLQLRNVTVDEAFRAALMGTGLVARIQATGGVVLARESRAGDGGISGVVTDVGTKRAVPSATVTIEGTKLTARTGDNGSYRFGHVPSGKHMLIVRRLGYIVTRIPVTVTDDKITTADISLTASATVLEDVVTTVTGPQRRLELGNVVGVINADSLVKEAPITSLSQLLTSRVPGLAVSQGQGTVGGNVRLQIRGLTSLALNSEPIVIVDGIRYTSQAKGDYNAELVSPLNDLNPNDIETVEVVKGPSASTLYGTDASNGVIVITTKHGKAGPPRWNVYATGITDDIPKGRIPAQYFGWSHDEFGFNSNTCFLDWVSHGFCVQDSVTYQPSILDNTKFSILKPSQSTSYGANVSGGQREFRYYLAGNIDNATGPVSLSDTVAKLIRAQRGVSKLPDEFVHPNTQTMLNLKTNITASVGPKLEVSLNSGFTHTGTRSITTSFQPYVGVVNGADTSTVNRYASEYFATTSEEGSDRFLVGANGTGRLTSWLTARGTVGLDAATRTRSTIIPRDTTRLDNNPTGFANQGRVRQLGTSADAGLTATWQRRSLSSRTSIGGQYLRSVTDGMNTVGVDLPPGTTSILQAKYRYPSQEYQETVTLGGYAEETIGFAERLFLTGAVRADGASSFGSGYAAAVYPKLSASWLLSREPFMPQISGLDEVRFRAALGVSAKQPDPSWALPTYQVLGEGSLPDGTGYDRPVYLQAFGNPEIRPERGRELETGVDIGLLNRRMQVELTWYRRRTEDQLVQASLPAGLGEWYQIRYTNLGLTTERGFEGQLSATMLDTRLLSWDIVLQHSQRATKLVHLGGTSPFIQNGGGYAEGYPIGARFIVPIESYSDANGDGIIGTDEVQLADTFVYAGVNAPPRTRTVTSTVGLFQRRVRISANLDHQTGGTQINEQFRCATCRVSVDPTTPLAVQAMAVASTIYTPNLPQYRYVEASSFTRLREVAVAVTLPSRVLDVLHMTSGSMTFSGRNLALWTHVTSADPESGDLPGVFRQPGEVSLPQSRTWLLRFDIGL